MEGSHGIPALSSPLSDQTKTDLMAEPPMEMRRPEPMMMGGGMGHSSVEDNMDTAARVLSLAQQTADQAIADARREADETLNRARREADDVLTKARRQAEQITGDARARAESLERDAQERHRQAMGAAGAAARGASSAGWMTFARSSVSTAAASRRTWKVSCVTSRPA